MYRQSEDTLVIPRGSMAFEKRRAERLIVRRDLSRSDETAASSTSGEMCLQTNWRASWPAGRPTVPVSHHDHRGHDPHQRVG
jgi:hypothetical protein